MIGDQVRGLAVGEARRILQFNNRKGAFLIYKLLESAVANAEHNNNADIDDLKISRIFVDEGPVYKRFRPRAKGRSTRVLKRTSHITLWLSDTQAG